MKSLVSTKTFSYILILLTLYISFLYFNGVFFIYKYKQLTNNAKPHSIISLIYFILPTLCYYMIILSLSSNFTVYPKKVFVILIFTTSFMLKVCSYYIDILIISQPKMVCFILCVQNVLIAVVDCFLHHLLDILFYSRKHRFSKFILLSVLIEEMPNYVFAVIFNMVELMYIKSFKPYFDIAAILYLLTGILICKTDLRKILCFELELMLKKQKLESINEKITQNSFAINQNITLSTVYRYLSNIVLAKKSAKTYKNIDLDSKQQMAKKENTLYSNKYKLILYITKIINTSLDTFIYFYLMSEMREQSYLVMYFSINFLFKTVDVKLKPSMLVRFVSFKYFLTFLSLFSIFYLDVYRHYLFLLLCFMANGLLNQIIYRSFERCCERKEVVVAEIMIFGLVACLVLYYGQKPDESFEDFVFFSSVRL